MPTAGSFSTVATIASNKLGPGGEGEGPGDICDEVARLVGDKVRADYPNAKVTQTRRGICCAATSMNVNGVPSFGACGPRKRSSA
jgi:hypothetical protein